MNTAQSLQITHLPYGVTLPEKHLVWDTDKVREVRQKVKDTYSKSIISHVITLFKAPVV